MIEPELRKALPESARRRLDRAAKYQQKIRSYRAKRKLCFRCGNKCKISKKTGKLAKLCPKCLAMDAERKVKATEGWYRLRHWDDPRVQERATSEPLVKSEKKRVTSSRSVSKLRRVRPAAARVAPLPKVRRAGVRVGAKRADVRVQGDAGGPAKRGDRRARNRGSRKDPAPREVAAQPIDGGGADRTVRRRGGGVGDALPKRSRREKRGSGDVEAKNEGGSPEVGGSERPVAAEGEVN